MAWHQTGNNQLSEPVVKHFTDVFIHHLWVDYPKAHIDGLVQERRNSIANVLELRFCIKPSNYDALKSPVSRCVDFGIF